MERKKKLRLFQTILLIVGIIIIFIIYTDKGLFLNKKINQKTTPLIENKTTGQKENIFYKLFIYLFIIFSLLCFFSNLKYFFLSLK